LARTLLVVFLIAGGFLVLYLALKKKIEARTDAASVLKQIRDEVDRLIVELNQTTDRNITLIEDKLASLNEQLALADKRIVMLRREAVKDQAGTHVYSNLVIKRADEPAAAGEDIHQQVLGLHLSGLTPPMIAKRLGKPLAEVDLIISLSARRKELQERPR